MPPCVFDIHTLLVHRLHFPTAARKVVMVACCTEQNAPTNYRHTSDKVIVGVFAFIVGGKNIINFLVWTTIIAPGAAAAGGGGEEQSGDLTDILRNEVLYFTGLGVRAAVRAPKPLLTLCAPKPVGSLHGCDRCCVTAALNLMPAALNLMSINSFLVLMCWFVRVRTSKPVTTV